MSLNIEAALSVQGLGAGLRSLELRTSPESSWESNDRFLRQVLGSIPSSASRRAGCEIGLVLHFIKGRGDRTTAGSPAAHGSGSNADPRRPQDRLHADPNPTGYRYAGYFRKVLTQARALASTIRRNPLLLQLLRGLDICNDERLMLHLHREDALRWVGFPDGIEDAGSGELLNADDRRLIRQYLTDGAVFERGQLTEPYAISDEGPILAALQAEVRREVGRRGITVEVNPSSNLLIGDFGDLRRHPFWRLAGPPGFDLDVPPVSICLGSDDPITFVTDIRHEYQLVYGAVLAGGASAAEALRWIDELRQQSLDVRFTVPFRVERTVRRSVRSHPRPFGNPRVTR